MKTTPSLLRSAVCLAAVLHSPGVDADFQFRSRPDLSPPRLNITVSPKPESRSSLSPGYIFVAQYPGFEPGNYGPIQPGAYIFRNDGELVWSGVGYLGGWAADFGPATWRGKPALRSFQGGLVQTQGRGYGDHVILNEHYEVVKTVYAGSHRLVSLHEFELLDEGDEGTVLVEVPILKPVGLKKWGGDQGQDWIIDNGFQGMI